MLLSDGYFEYVTITVIKHVVLLITNPLIDYLNLINFNLHPSMQVNGELVPWLFDLTPMLIKMQISCSDTALSVL